MSSRFPDAPEDPTMDAPRFRKEEVFEVLVFLFLIVPSAFLASLAVKQEAAGFSLTAWATILRDLALVFLIIFFIWRNGEPFRRLGYRFAGRWRDVIIGLVLFIPATFIARLLEVGLEHAGIQGPSGKLPSFLFPHGPWQIALATLMVIVVAWSEETMFRGYLILRLSAGTRSLFWAVILSTIIFALGHGYEGLAGMITVAYLGLVFALVYVWRRSLVAPMVMHFLQDFINIVIVAAVVQK